MFLIQGASEKVFSCFSTKLVKVIGLSFAKASRECISILFLPNNENRIPEFSLIIFKNLNPSFIVRESQFVTMTFFTFFSSDIFDKSDIESNGLIISICKLLNNKDNSRYSKDSSFIAFLYTKSEYLSFLK